MKLTIKKPQKLRKRHLLAILFGGLIVVGASGFILFKTQIARSAIASDDKFRFVMPYFGGSSQGTDVYLEISQPGINNTLDAPEAWAKIYIDPSRVDDATIGVFAGGYANGVDSQGYKFRGLGGAFPDDDSTRFEFYLGRDAGQSGFQDEAPCPDKSTEKLSGSMSSTGWWKIDAARFKGYNCLGASWEPTSKTGKYVVFVRAVWRQNPNPISEGRLNAFKIGAAYASSTNSLDNPITGYWSNYTAAITSGLPRTAAYSVQDRKSPDGTQGNYTFSFAPDCRIPQDQTDTQQRYLHWKDVDYPGYYSSQPAPYFDIIEISPSGQRRNMTELHVDKDTIINGQPAFGQNRHASLPFRGKGGYKYEWIWHNITRVDGVSFWLPYDDYPSLAGCGSYKQNIGLQGTRGAGWSSNDFNVAGGDTVTFSLDERYDSGTSAAPETTSNATLTSQGGALFANTFEGDGAINISDGGYRNGSRVRVQWKLPGMGPGDPYASSRRLYFSYKVKDDAQNGARHCFNADLTPVSNTNPTGTATSNTICITIDNSLRPFVGTSGANVHAGSCKLEVGTTKSIIGQVSPSGARGSSGSYVVSAGGSINGFGSGGSPVGTGLTLGKSGRYGPMCRPTEQAMKTEFDKDKATEVVWTNSTTLDLGSLPAGRVKVTMPGGGTITGTARGPVTVYSPGTVTITGATVGAGSGAASRTNLPVVGVMARTIAIENNVTTLNAILYATGNIDTCSNVANWSASGFAGCRSTLTLNGFAMAGSFSFKRISAATSGVQTGEQLNFNAAFYLNPPPGFGLPADAVRYLGERTPLY